MELRVKKYGTANKSLTRAQGAEPTPLKSAPRRSVSKYDCVLESVYAIEVIIWKLGSSRKTPMPGHKCEP